MAGRSSRLVAAHPKPRHAEAGYAVVLSRALTITEIMVSCYNNQLNFDNGIDQQVELLKLYKAKQDLEMVNVQRKRPDPNPHNFREWRHALRRAIDVITDRLISGCAERMLFILDVMADCGLGGGIPCRHILDVSALPLGCPSTLASLTIKEIALGQPIVDIIDGQLRSYRQNPNHQGMSDGQLQPQLWHDLPPEIRRLLEEPKPEPNGLLVSFRCSFENGELREAVRRCLEDMRQTARTDAGNHVCRTCHPNDHRLVQRPRGSLMIRFVGFLRKLRGVPGK